MARNLEIDGRKLKDIQVINAVDSDTKEYVPYVDTHDATATSEDIIEGKTAYVDGKEVVGTHPDIQSPYASFGALVDGSITEVTAEMLEGVTEIRSYAFYYCDSLTSITIPDSVTLIDKYAFSDCTSLTSVTIPDSVTSIGIYAFSYCGKLTSITIPNGVTSIGVSVFSYCGNLTSVIIGNGVTRIDNSVFYFCGVATESGTIYTILATTPPTIQSDTFSNAKINKIIVPKGTLAAYKSATNWSALADKIEEATE